MYILYGNGYQPKGSPTPALTVVSTRPRSLVQPKGSPAPARQQPDRKARHRPTHMFHDKDPEDDPDSWKELADDKGSKRTKVHDTRTVTGMNQLVSSIFYCYMFCNYFNMLCNMFSNIFHYIFLLFLSHCIEGPSS